MQLENTFTVPVDIDTVYDALNDPEKLKRFRTFVNSDKVDSNIEFVEERGQIRPINEQERQARNRIPVLEQV